jgi:type IV pilus assembly protein PilM
MSTIEEMEEIEDAWKSALQCPLCAVANPPQRKFCAKCGASLWETCFQCGGKSAAGETYCGGCGTNLVEVVAERLGRLEADFRIAAELRSEWRFNEAIALLLPITKNEHPRLAEHASRAEALIRELTIEYRQQHLAAEENCRRATLCFEAFDFDGAAEILEAIRPTLRTDAIVELSGRVATKQQEIASLAEELHEAVREQRLLDLPPQIQRLLAVKPDHAYARRLAGQVQKHLVVAAKKRLAEYDYDQALRLLEQIAPNGRDPQTQELYQRAAELAWLTWDLRNAPVIDRTLVATAERLQRLAPSDARVMKLCAQLQHRAGPAESPPRRAPLPWARPPQQTALGVPVDCPSGFQRLICAESMDPSELRQCPGRFAVACGLALAGIRQAAIEINLLRAEQRGLMSQVTRLIQPRTARKAWGIDIGSSGLKAVKLAWDEANQQAIIEAVALIEHAKLLNYAVNDAEKDRLVSETLQAFLESQQPKTERVCVGLPGRMALSHQIDLPPTGLDKMAKVIQLEASNQFPLPLEQLAWDFQLVDGDHVGSDRETEPPDKQGRQALVIAARTTTTQDFLDTFRQLGVRVDVLQTDALALHNFLVYEYCGATEDTKQAEACPVLAALDIGAEVTNIVVSSRHSPWLHSCGVAGHSFTRALVKEFNLTLAQAEQRKRAPESAERLSDAYEALSPLFDDLLKEVQQSLIAYAQTRPDQPIQRVLGFGGGAMLHGLFRYLRCGR